MTSPPILTDAHGRAAELGAVLVAEAPGLRSLAHVDAGRTEAGLALRRVRGRPFTLGNTAASGRNSTLTRITVDPNAPEEQRRIHRKAASLARQRIRELSVQGGGDVSSAVRVEVVAWARDTAWAEHYDRQGDPMTASTLAERASGHQLKATGIAEREAAARPRAPVDPIAAIRARLASATPTRPVHASAHVAPTPASSDAASAPDGRAVNEESGDS